MRKIKYIVMHSSNEAEHKTNISDAILNASDYLKYIKKHGYHFTDKLAEYACKMMDNVSNVAHSWSVGQVKNSVGTFTPMHNETFGDLTYTANMAYADFYPSIIDTTDKCIAYSKAVATDPDGYEGIEFIRWVGDVIGKSININWEDFV